MFDPLSSRKPHCRAAAILLVVVLAVGAVSAAPRSLVRDSIPEQYKWDLSHIYPNWEAWEADLARLDSLVDVYENLRGTLHQGPVSLLRVFHVREQMDKLYELISGYAGLSYATERLNNDIAAKWQRKETLRGKRNIAQAWFRPELLSLPWDTLQAWLAGEPALAPYEYELRNEFRRREHVLDTEQEKLLSYFARFRSSPGNIYDALTAADVAYPTIRLSTGEEVTLTDGRYNNVLVTARNQADRAEAFDSALSVYSKNAHTHAAIYAAILQRDWATAQARGYASAVQQSLDRDNIPVEVYENLIATVHDGSEAIRRYYRLKEEVMGLDGFHMYDRFIPIVDFEAAYDYDDAVGWVIASVAPLGEDYQSKLREGFENRWIDVYENEGKSTGGFSSGVYGVHPYVLINYNETAGEMFTVAHEMGHSLHTVLADETQPYATAGYTIFVAEIAAIANEQLLLDYLLDHTEDPKERVYLLQFAIESLRGTFYRQVVFADFELRAHRLVENGLPVTAEALYDQYMNSLTDMYGETLVRDSLLGYYWSAVPHFHGSPYYVYKYATSYAAASYLIRNILESEGAARQQAVDHHLNLLRAGGSDYPMELLKQAGLDMADPQTYRAIISLTEDLVTRLESELAGL